MTREDLARYRRVIAAARKAAADVDRGVLGLYEFATRALSRWPEALDEIERQRTGIDAARKLLSLGRAEYALHVLDCLVASPGYEPPTELDIEKGEA